MKIPSLLPAFFRAISGLATAAAILLSLAAPASAVIDNNVTQQIWKMKYGVTNAQLADQVWLDSDSDGDGIKNKDEIAAGTNPFSAGSSVKITSIVGTSTAVDITFPTEDGKQYIIQGTPALTTAFTAIGVNWAGTGVAKTLNVIKGSNKFFRVLVQDMDSDGDGASDWAEKVAGYNPNNALDGGASVLNAVLATSDVVTVSVTKPSATQPLTGFAPVETGSITVSRGGPLKFHAITVPLQISGSALGGTDYDALPTSVTLPINVGEFVLPVNPRANSARKTNVTAIVKALAGPNYILGSKISGSVVINPAGIANGTGLTASYYNTSSSNYSSGTGTLQTTIFGTSAQMTRTDAAVDFGVSANTIVANIALGSPSCVVTTTRANSLTTGDSVTIAGVTGGTFSPAINGTFVVTVTSGTTFTIPVACTVVPTSVTSATLTAANNANGWAGTANGGPRGMSPASASTAYSIRWTGQILPQYSETYNIDFRSDDGAKVWVNGQLLIDRWVSQGATDGVNTIALQAGILYDIQIDYYNGSGAAEAKLYWWSPSQVKEIIPQSRLFPAPTLVNKVTPITSLLTATGYVGTPFSFNVTASDIGANITYAIATDSGPLPPGLSLNTATGAITGTPSVAGTYNVAINSINPAIPPAGTVVTGSSIVTFTIFPAGGVTREILTAGGSNVSNIVIPSPSIIPAHDTISTVDDDVEYANNTGERLRGYIIPPKTGNYYFWIAANNAAELWISNDSEYVNRVRRATLTADSGKKVWNAFSTQQTAWLSLVAGQKYYFEVLHNTGVNIVDDYVAMGWCQDDIGTVPSTSTSPNAAGAVTLIPNDPTSIGTKLQGYPLSGTVPGYIFQPYDYPVVTPPTGTLYACNLGPQTSAITSASGSANIQVNAGETQAILHFKYQNLGTPKTSYHLHVDGFTGDDLVVHPQGEIIYDIDDADQNPPEQTGDGGYIWAFNNVGSFSSATQLREALHKGKVYLNIHSVGYPSGEIRGTFGLIDGSQTPPDASLYPEPSATDVASDPTNAARFLNQATFGASPTQVAAVQGSSFPAWIFADQLTKPASHTSNDVVAGLTADINTPYPSSLFTDSWWKNSVVGQDQLRQRLAFALSEIMVVSWANNTGPLQNNGRILADYYDQLVDYCLPTSGLPDSGNFRGILKAVTLTPAMGLYLDMRGNQKGDDTLGRHPNENYGREIMQLFSVGIYRMWDDGRFVLGADAGLVPTYSQPNIIGLANLLTGWNYAQPNQANGRAPSNFGPAADYLNPMVLVPAQHELGSKLLLNNAISPAATGRTPRVSIASIVPAAPTTNPCTVNTSTIHGLRTGDTITIAGVTTGTFTGGLTAINATFQVTVTSATAFTVPVACTAAGSGGTVTGATVTPAAIVGTGGITAVTGSQADNAGTGANHPYDLYGTTELDRAVDNIVNNDNVPPYICRQLIQRLVTSNPSPGYIYRVVQKFKNNGSGVRGDLAAVVSQILLDGEARRSSITQTSTTFGKQREPMLRLTGTARAFPAVNYTGTYTQLTGINANKLRIVTSATNNFSSGFTVGLNFQGNYTTTTPPSPSNNPTSTNYSINATLGIANTTTDISAIDAAASPTLARVHTVQPHGLSTGNAVIITGVTGGTFIVSTGGTTAAPITTQRIVTVVDSLTFDLQGVSCTVAPTSVASAKMISNPCKITTVQAHGLTSGDSVTISGTTGTFTPAISGSTFTVTVVDATSFTVASNCTVASAVNTGNLVGANTLDVTATGISNATYTQAAGSNILMVNTGGPQTNTVVPGTTVNITSIVSGAIPATDPCVITTSTAHNLVTGGVVTIAGVTDGTFGTGINGTFVPTVTGATTFTVPVVCTVAPLIYTAGTTTTTKLTRSKVYLAFLTQTTAGGAAIPADSSPGIGTEVQTANGTTSFTITTADTPVTARGGNVLLPKFTSSYTPSGTNILYNNNVNHNLQLGDHFWVDVPVVGSPLTDAEYAISIVTDEDHFTTSRTPTVSNGGTYPNPSGSNNGSTIYPLVPPPLGRSGSVTINQSTFNLSSTEATLTQSPLNAPTVFNYFFPNYKFPGTLANTGLDSPEFQLTTDTNVMNLTNSLTNMVIGTGGGNGNLNGLTSFNNGSGTLVMDIGSYMKITDDLSNGAIPALVAQLAKLLVGAPLETNTTNTIVGFVANNTNFPYTTPTPTQKRDRVRAIIHLIITSAEFAVQK